MRLEVNSKRSVLIRIADEINTLVEARFFLVASLFVLLFLVCAIGKDLLIPMWTDEFFTLYMSQQPSASEIVRATLEGCDGAPPLYAMIVRAIAPVVLNPALAVRLPSTLGFCAMVICLLAFCRRRLPATYSLCAALLVCSVCLYLSTEGRSYGVVLGCAAGALLCWQAAIEGRRRAVAIPLLAFCIALMTAMHFYAVFFLFPLFLGEIVRWHTSRRLDFPVLAALTSALFVLGLNYPLIAASAPSQAHFWSTAGWHNIPELYSMWFVPILMKCMLPVGVLAVISTTPDEPSAEKPGPSLPEWVATGAFSLMPICVVILSKYTTHVFVPRYVLWAVPGFGVLVVALLCQAARGRAAVGVSLLALLTLGALGQVRHLWERPALQEGEVVLQALATLPDSTEPIVVADLHVFTELSYYERSPVRERVVFPVDRDLDLRSGSDTDFLLMTALSHRTKLHILGLNAILAGQPRFVLAAMPDNHLPWYLVEAGYQVVPIGSSLVPVLFEVETPKGK
jgi:hypothetical protein